MDKINSPSYVDYVIGEGDPTYNHIIHKSYDYLRIVNNSDLTKAATISLVITDSSNDTACVSRMITLERRTVITIPKSVYFPDDIAAMYGGDFVMRYLDILRARTAKGEFPQQPECYIPRATFRFISGNVSLKTGDVSISVNRIHGGLGPFDVVGEVFAVWDTPTEAIVRCYLPADATDTEVELNVVKCKNALHELVSQKFASVVANYQKTLNAVNDMKVIKVRD